MSLSRAAKKFRDQMLKKPEPAKPGEAKRKGKAAPAAAPAPAAPPPVEPVKPAEPTPEPQAVATVQVPGAAPQPKKVWPVKAKRRRFTREQTEKRVRASGPALPPRSTKFNARRLTKNLVPPPGPESPKTSR